MRTVLTLVAVLASGALALACGGEEAGSNEGANQAALSTLGEQCETNDDCGEQRYNGDLVPMCWASATTTPYVKGAETLPQMQHTCVLYCTNAWTSDPEAACKRLTGHGCVTTGEGWSLCSP